MEALRTLRSKLEEYGLSQDVTRLEVADTEQLAFLYQDRISVLLGTCLLYTSQLFEQLQKQKDFAPGDSLVVKEYINNMPELLAAADLVICLLYTSVQNRSCGCCWRWYG